MPIPDETRDRWSNRAEPDSGKGAIYWHMLFRDNPAVRATARKAQARLAPFRDLHMTPEEWLHATALVAGTTEDISSEDLDLMLSGAQQHLGSIQPINVTISRVLYHPEAIMLGFTPEGALDPIHQRRTAGHARGNRADGQRYRACRAVDSPYNDLLQHGQTAHGTHRRCARARSSRMRHNRESRQPGYPVGA